MFNEQPLSPDEIERCWAKASEDSPSDAAKLHFLASLYTGEAWLKRVSTSRFSHQMATERLVELDWGRYERAKGVKGYGEAKHSVRQAWKEFCRIEYGLSSQALTDRNQINQMLLINGVRRSLDERGKVQAMHNRWGYFLHAFLAGNLDFFRKLGKALSGDPPKPGSDHEVGHTLLNYWLTRLLWLMDEKTLATTVGIIHQVSEPPAFTARVKQTKVRWKLRSAKPALIIGITSEWKLKLSDLGAKVLSVR